MARVIELTPELCKSVTKQNGVVLLYFNATWCGACLTMGRIIAQIIDETPDELLIAKCNIETCLECAASYEVSSIPRMVIFKDGVALFESNSSCALFRLSKNAFTDSSFA